eukprot:COSAG05_NODE_455_length_9636_cov_370.199203_2_plen_124_part_00
MQRSQITNTDTQALAAFEPRYSIEAAQVSTTPSIALRALTWLVHYATHLALPHIHIVSDNESLRELIHDAATLGTVRHSSCLVIAREVLPALLLSILYVCLAAVLRVSQGGSVTVGVSPLTSA